MSQPNVLGNIHFNAELDEKNDVTLLFTINMKLKPIEFHVAWLMHKDWKHNTLSKDIKSSLPRACEVD